MRGLVLIIVAGFGLRPIRRRCAVGGRRRALYMGAGIGSAMCSCCSHYGGWNDAA